MKKKRSVLSSTYVDSHGMKMTRQVLADNVRRMKGPRAVSVGVEHDMMFPPAGKWVNAYVEAIGDGEFRLIGTQEFMETVEEVVIEGKKFLVQACPNDTRPLLVAEESSEEKPVISIDSENFTDQETVETFLDALANIGSGEFETDFLLRKTTVPDPEIVIHVSHAVYAWLSAVVLTGLGSSMSEDVSRFYKFMKGTIFTYAQMAVPKNRPKTYVVVVPGSTEGVPHVQFIARSTKPQKVLKSLEPGQMAACLEKAKMYKDAYGAEKVQFAMNESGEWDMTFILTADGKVIGEEHIINKRDEVIRKLQNKHGPL